MINIENGSSKQSMRTRKEEMGRPPNSPDINNNNGQLEGIAKINKEQ